MRRPLLAAPIPDSQIAFPGLGNVKVAAMAAAGAVGTLVVFGVGFGLARISSLPPRRASHESQPVAQDHDGEREDVGRTSRS